MATVELPSVIGNFSGMILFLVHDSATNFTVVSEPIHMSRVVNLLILRKKSPRCKTYADRITIT